MVFDTVDAAEKAIREVQGFSLFEKPMVLQFAKAKSDAFVKATGTDEELDAHKRRRMAEKGGLLGWCGVWVCTGEGDEDVYRRLVGEEEFNSCQLSNSPFLAILSHSQRGGRVWIIFQFSRTDSLTGANGLQNASSPLKKRRSHSNDHPLALPLLHLTRPTPPRPSQDGRQRKRPQDSNPPTRQQRPASPTNTSRPIRCCSCNSSQQRPQQTYSQACLGGLKGSRRFEWSLGGKGWRLWSMSIRRGRLARRRRWRGVCLCREQGLLRLRTRDSSLCVGLGTGALSRRLKRIYVLYFF